MMPSNTRMPTIQFNQNGVSQNRQPLNLVEVEGGMRLQENRQKMPPDRNAVKRRVQRHPLQGRKIK